MLPYGNWHSCSAFLPMSVILSSHGKSRANLFGHLHSQLQVCRLLGSYPSLNIALQTVNETEESFRIINITTLREPFTKPDTRYGLALLTAQQPLSIFSYHQAGPLNQSRYPSGAQTWIQTCHPFCCENQEATGASRQPAGHPASFGVEPY